VNQLRHLVHGLVHPRIWLALGLLSVVAFVATAIAVPLWLGRIPKDYFLREAEPKSPLGVRILKNLLGVVLVAIGIAMLVLPGQGLLTIALGLGLVDFPGRRRVELAVIGRPGVLKTINALRRKLGQEALELPSGR
jgi:uncharacterized membrane protein YczE